MSSNRRLDRKKAVLFKNTFMLYVLQFSTYILTFIAIPYETRVVGKEIYGKVGTASAIMVYIQMVIDFGFILSATEQASRNRNDSGQLSKIFTCATINKLILAAISGCVLYVLCLLIPSWKPNTAFFMLYFISTAINALMPDFIYRGLEQMTTITIRAVCIRVFFTCMIFVVLQKPSDYYVIPILNIIGNLGAILAIYFHMFRKLNVRFCNVTKKEVSASLRSSSTFFYSRIASSLYTKSNYIILSLVGVSSGDTGLYTSADHLIGAVQNCVSPISDSLYPYMVKNHDYKLVKKALMIMMPIIVAGVTVVFIFAEPLCVWFFGADFAGTGKILRAMLPIAIVILPSYVCGFPMLSSMGLTKFANYSTIFGSVMHLVNLAVLYVTGYMNVVTLGIAVSVTETLILLFRLSVIWKHRDRLKQPSQPKEDA